MSLSRRMKIRQSFAVLALMSLPALSHADELIETYTAFLSERDHFSSKGERLRDAAAIIRQDRANFHKYGKRDIGDESDNFFASARNREILERFLKRGRSTAAALNAIINGTPYITVRIYVTDSGENYINVSVQ
jgi:hypothetical protein